MTTIAKLLARKQRLLELLREQPGPAEELAIERQLAEINHALDLFEREEVAIDQPMFEKAAG